MHTIGVFCCEVQKIKSKREFVSQRIVYCTPAMLDECDIITCNCCATDYKFTSTV